MNIPNEVITIFKGDFFICNGTKKARINGEIRFEWFPESGCFFSGLLNYEDLTIFINHIQHERESFLSIGELKFGNCFIQGFSFSSSNNKCPIKGVMEFHAFTGDKSVKVEKINFELLNIKSFEAYSDYVTKNDSYSRQGGRFSFEIDDYTIKVDKHPDYEEQLKKLKETGGYFILGSGELSNKKGAISFEESEKVFELFTYFLWFIQGRRITPIFRKGIFHEEEIWSDYGNYISTNFKRTLFNWNYKTVVNINHIWTGFKQIWKQDESGKSFIKTILGWYIDLMEKNTIIDGKMIIAQAALELIYNWLIVETKKMILGKDSENISASNKIRLLISNLNIPGSVPLAAKHIFEFSSTHEYLDFPEAFVQIRNMIVHSQEEKRRKLASIPHIVRHEAVEIALEYIELSLLFIFKYQGKYSSRMLVGGGSYIEKELPWIIK